MKVYTKRFPWSKTKRLNLEPSKRPQTTCQCPDTKSMLVNMTILCRCKWESLPLKDDKYIEEWCVLQHSKWNKGLWNVHSLMTILSITMLILQLGADNINSSIAIMKITLLYLRCYTMFDWWNFHLIFYGNQQQHFTRLFKDNQYILLKTK